jgi:site-specific DNA-cytosine methylase
MKRREYTVLHLFCGIGGGGLGSAEARAQLDGHEAKFRVMGGVDLDAQACQDFERLVKAPALRGDIAKMQPSHLVEKFGTRSPDFVLLSSPCKAFSGLLSKKLSETKKYQDMAMLTVEGIHLVLSTWATNPRVIFMENVPRITSRGAHLLDTIRQTLAAHGYAVSEGYHDCGELGGLGQRRRRSSSTYRRSRGSRPAEKSSASCRCPASVGTPAVSCTPCPSCRCSTCCAWHRSRPAGTGATCPGWCQSAASGARSTVATWS